MGWNPGKRRQDKARKYPKQRTSGPIRWTDIPHEQVAAHVDISLRLNAVERSAEDSLRHILRRRLSLLSPEDHRRFIEFEACRIVELLRSTARNIGNLSPKTIASRFKKLTGSFSGLL